MDIQIFQNEQFGAVRTLLIDGEPWFVAADVCKALDIKNVSDAIGKLDDDEKRKVSENGVTTDPRYNLGSTNTAFFHEINIVNEPGLYRLIFQSRKPEAKKFQR